MFQINPIPETNQSLLDAHITESFNVIRNHQNKNKQYTRLRTQKQQPRGEGYERSMYWKG